MACNQPPLFLIPRKLDNLNLGSDNEGKIGVVTRLWQGPAASGDSTTSCRAHVRRSAL